MKVGQLFGVHGTMDLAEAVAYVLIARFHKRVASQLGTITTRVVSPVGMLDYVPPASD